MRWVTVLGLAIGGLVAVVVAAGAALWIGGGPVVAWVVQHPGSAFVGRQIRFAGPVHIHWGNPTRIIAEDVHVANASWGTQPDMFSAKRVEIDLFVRSLLHGPARIPLIQLDGAKLLLETSAQGVGNWKFSLNSAAPKRRHQFPDLRRFVVHDSELLWHNGRTGAHVDLAVGGLEYNAPSPASPVSIMAAGTYAGSFQKLPFRFAGTVGALTELRNPTKPYPIKFTGKAGPIDFATDGTIEHPLDFSGVDLRLSMSGRRLDELGSALGVPLPALPDFRGTSELTGGNGKWALKALTIALGKSDLEGGLAINTNDKVPYVRANLTSSRIDLADFKGLAGGTPAHASAPAAPPHASDRILPDTPINVHKLPGLNADVAFYGTHIVSRSGLPFDSLSLNVQLKNGELTVKPLRFHTASGDVDLSLHFTPFTQNTPPRLSAEVDVRHVDLHELLGTSSSAIVRETGGIVGGFAKVDTTGTTMRDLLARMNGDAGIFMQNGQISALAQELAPVDVLGALGVYVTGDRPVPIKCLVSRFDIKKGIATASTLLFNTSDVMVVGAGNLNFADETVDLKLTPYNEKFAVVSLRVPVTIGGTFAHRTYHVETGSLIARLGAAVGLGVVFPPAALLPLIDTGLGERNACSAAYAAEPPRGNPTPTTGSSSPQGAKKEGG